MSHVRTPVALALRALQKLDELDSIPNRHLLIEAQTQLGKDLGLECTGVRDGEGYEHNGDTCPIHEWLVPGDAATIEVGRRG